MQQQDRIKMAETSAYMWACDTISSSLFKKHLAYHGFDIDLRQQDTGASLEVLDVESGEIVILEV